MAAVLIFATTALPSSAMIMVLVLHRFSGEPLGPATAAVTLGVYAGFASGPMALGPLVDLVGYPAAWAAATILRRSASP